METTSSLEVSDFSLQDGKVPTGRCLLVPGAPHPTRGARPGPSYTAVLALGPEWPAGLSRVMLSVGTGSLAHLSVRFQARSLGQIERNCHGTGLRVDMGWHGARVSHLSRGDLSMCVVWCWGAPCVLPSPEQGWFIMAPSEGSRITPASSWGLTRCCGHRLLRSHPQGGDAASQTWRRMETGRRKGSQGEAELGCSSSGFGSCKFGHELRQTSADGEGQRSLVRCSPWGLEESDTTGRRNSNDPKDAWDQKSSITLKVRLTTGEVGLWQVTGEDDVISGGDACLDVARVLFFQPSISL